ncbi:DUF6457 domain-containing protein [Ammonicoccus fulvus]|uniref:DUF6457 domain-containing protein n=1 Tax=Ammonicoccus fulvus TaxID=3138240 RepID=A0ABZ3FK38_9ACTN
MPHDRNQDLSELYRWLDAVAPELGVNSADIPVGDVLDLSKVVAHDVTRPGVPVTAFLAGLAVGSGLNPDALATLTERARNWTPAG